MKQNDKVKFTDCAKHLKSYDANAVGIVISAGASTANVKWTRQDGSKFSTVCVRLSNLDLLAEEPEEQITLKPGDWCSLDGLSDKEGKDIAAALMAAGANGGDGHPYNYINHWSIIEWDKINSSVNR